MTMQTSNLAKKMFLFAVSALTVSCTSMHAKLPAETIADDPQLKIIDAHTHATFTGEKNSISGIPATREEYLKELHEAGAIGAVSHAHEGVEIDDTLKNENVIQCYGLRAKSDMAALEKGLKSGRYGCVKVYLGYVHQWAYDKNYEPAYKLAEKYNVPVVFHTGDTDSTVAKIKYSDPLTIDEVAVDHPKVNFVIAHCGNPWHASAAEVAYKNPNVYIECSALMIGDLSRVSDENKQRYVVEPISWIYHYLEDPKKMIFGTDWPLTQIKPYLDLYKKAIPRDQWQAVFHDNAARVFHFKK